MTANLMACPHCGVKSSFIKVAKAAVVTDNSEAVDGLGPTETDRPEDALMGYLCGACWEMLPTEYEGILDEINGVPRDGNH